MNDKPVIDPKSDLIARMESLSKGSEGVSYRDFEHLLREMENVSVPQLKQVVYFASDQLGFWEAEWLFSPADSPNTIAAAETEGWRLICRSCTDALVKNVPDVRRPLEQQQNLTLLRHAIKRRVDYDKTRPLSRLAANVLGRMSFGLNKLGFEGIAKRLYSRGLYPKGTVGRTSE